MAKAGSKELRIEVSQAVRAISTLNKAIDANIDKVKQHVTAQKAANTVANQTTTVMQKVITSYTNQRSAIQAAITDIQKHATSLRDNTRAMDINNRGTSTSNTLIRQINSAYRSHITTLAAVQSKVQQLASTRVANTNAHVRETKEINSTTIAMGQLNSAVGTIVSRMNTKNNVLRQQTQATNADATATKGLANHWSLFARIIVASALHRAVGLLTNEIRESLETYHQLSLRIAEIQTIQGTAGLATEEWQKKLSALSNEFGIPILQVAEGTYQAISNQVVNAGNATSFMREEMKLAITTVGSLDNAVNATSTVLKAYNLDTSHADVVNAKLFTTINLGRIRLDELGSGFGRLSAQSSLLGVSFDEQQAAISALSVQGIAADVTLTLLQNVMSKLAKPTQEMNQLLHSWGVESGTAAIQAFGLVGVLRKLHIAAENSATPLEDISGLFQDIRATVGAAGLVKAFDTFDNHLKAHQESFDEYGKAVDITMDAVGRKVNITFEEMRNAIINRFGKPVTDAFLNFIGLFGDGTNAANTMVDSLRTLIIVGASWRAALILIDSATRAYNVTLTVTQIRQAAVTFGLTLLIAAIIEGTIRVKNYYESFDELATSIESAAQTTRDAGFEAYIDSINDKLLKSNAIFDESGRVIGAWAADINAKNNLVADGFDKAFKAIALSIKTGLEDPLKVIDKAIKDEEKAIESLKAEAERSTEKAGKLKSEEDIRTFDSKVAAAPDEKSAFKLLEDEKIRVHKAALAAIAAGDEKAAEENFARAIKLAEEQEKFIEKAKERAVKEVGEDDPLGVAKIEKDALDLLIKMEAERKKIVTDRIAAETAAAAAATAAATAREASLEKQKKAFEDLKDALAQVDALAGKAKTPADGAKLSEALKRASGLAAAAGLDPKEQLLLFREAKAAEVKVNAEAEAKKTTDTVVELQKRTKAAIDAFKKNAETLAATDKKAVEVAAATGASGEGQFGAMKAFADNLRGLDVETIRNLQKALLDATVAASLLGSDETSIKNYEAALKILENTLKNFPADKLRFGLGGVPADGKGRFKVPEMAAAEDIITAERKKLAVLKAAKAAADEAFIKELELDNLKKQTKKIQDDILKKTKELKDATRDGGNVAVETIDQQIAKLKELYQALDAVAAKQRAMGGGGDGGGGGGGGGDGGKTPGFAFGGEVRGIDRVHALLADGETVMNQWASRQMQPYLAAMNHGPSLMNNSSTTNFGDIHIHTPVGTTDVQVKTIASELVRLNRRGQFNLR